MNKETISTISVACLVAMAAITPVFVFAAESFGVLGQFVITVMNFISLVLVPFLFAVALLAFIWGMFNYFILGGADEGKRAQGKSLALWAIIGFVLAVTIWGIVNLLSSGLFSGLGSTGTQKENVQNLPRVNTPPTP